MFSRWVWPSSRLFWPLNTRYKRTKEERKREKSRRICLESESETHHSGVYNAADFWSLWCIGEIRTGLIIKNRGNISLSILMSFCLASTIPSHPLPNKKPRRCNFITIHAVMRSTFGLGYQYQAGWLFFSERGESQRCYVYRLIVYQSRQTCPIDSSTSSPDNVMRSLSIRVIPRGCNNDWGESH